MPVLNKYRVHCLTDSKDEYVWAEAEPTTCPVDTAHSIDASLTAIVDTMAYDQVQLVDAAGVAPPTTSSGTPLFNPTIVPNGYYLYVTSAFDLLDTPSVQTVSGINALTPIVGESYKLTDAGTLTPGSLAVVIDDTVVYEGGAWVKITLPARGAGAQIGSTIINEGKDVISGRFMEHVYILGGAISAIGAGPQDWISFQAYAPASNPGSGTNAVKEAYGPINRFKPVASGGTHDVDGSTLEVGEINLNLAPVPSPSKTGYWNWDPSASPSITPAPTGEGSFDLFDVDIQLIRQANRISLMTSGDITPSTLKGKKMLPHWVMTFTIMRNEPGTLKAVARITTGRKTTV